MVCSGRSTADNAHDDKAFYCSDVCVTQFSQSGFSQVRPILNNKLLSIPLFLMSFPLQINLKPQPLHSLVVLRADNMQGPRLCNRIILASKCHAIRDAQIGEKDLIKKELDEEERR